MKCTLNWDFIPAAKHPQAATNSTAVDGIVRESKSRREPDPHSLRVFDLELMEWRSFRFERLQKITAELSFS
jgi:hypothetical protein